jgi:hypothetical protein
MKIRMSIAAVGVSALLGAGAFVLPAAASGHSESESHTLKFIAVQDKSTMFTQTTGAEQDTDINKAGKVIGFDMIYFAVSSKTTAALNLTLDTTGGFLYGTLTVNTSTGAITNGKVTGGTGSFTGATGTIKAKNLNNAGTRTAVTITYTT